MRFLAKLLYGLYAGVLFLVLSPWLKRLAHGADDTGPEAHIEPVA